MHTLLLRYSYALAMISVMFQCTYRDLADVPKYEFTCIHSQGATMIWAVSICTYQKLGEVFRPLPRFGWCSYALTKRWLMFPMPCVNYQDLREVRVHLQGSGIRCYAPARIWVMASYTYQDLGDAGMHLPEWMWMMTSCTYQTVGDGAMHLPGFGWRRHAPTRLWVMLPCSLMLVAMTKAASCCLSWYRPMICRQTESGDCRKKGTLQHSNQKHSLRASGIHFRFERKKNQPKSPRTIA